MTTRTVGRACVRTAPRPTAYGTVITAVDEKGREVGYVTVDEAVRNFALGVARPRRLQHGAEPTGRGWKALIYKAAIVSFTLLDQIVSRVDVNGADCPRIKLAQLPQKL